MRKGPVCLYLQLGLGEGCIIEGNLLIASIFHFFVVITVLHSPDTFQQILTWTRNVSGVDYT